ncbi:MAG TPA: tetratricopeptide repeat protein [Burkholderiales bacterium]|nr:tetratricopeptide repeat protein [Burkholderiales bacterium]
MPSELPIRDEELLDSLVRRGYAAQGAGRLDEAEQCYRDILRREPDHYDALYLLGTLLDSSRRSEDAAEFLRKAVALRPRETAFHEALGIALENCGQPAQAIACYRTVVVLDPSNALVMNNLGCLLRNEGDIAKARACFEGALLVRPDLAQAHYNLAKIAQDFGDPRGAVKHFRAVLQTQPGHAEVWNNLGCVLQSLGDLEEAAGAFRRALGARPDYGVAGKNLGGALRELGRLDEAVQAYEQASQLLPQDASIRHYLAALRQANPERASAAYVKEMFDQFAPKFDETLVEGLGYRTPQLLFEAIGSALDQPTPKLRILDLGCGTGLFGVQAAAISRRLTGVDLSGEMLKRAAARRCYQRLEERELLEFLRDEPPESYDLVAAVDVFVYFGTLSDIFARTRAVLAKEGLFAYSVEAELETDKDFRLGTTGRYSHSQRYLEALGREHGFAQLSFSPAILRQEKGGGVQGYVCLLRRLT